MAETDWERLSVPAHLDSLPSIGQFILHAACAAGLEDGASYGLRLAVQEIATNSITHGQTGQTSLDLHAVVEAQDLTITLEDAGAAFDPRQAPRPADLSLPLAERRLGGLGVYLALRSVDEFRYERVGNKNRHVFIMKRPASPTAAGQCR